MLVTILAWNLNHRAARRRLPAWISLGIAEKSPDVLILTEYVEGPDHDEFINALAASGLQHTAITVRRQRQNQILIAARDPFSRNALSIPDILPAVPSNAIEITLAHCALTVFGFRMPAYPRSERSKKRATWDWLLAESDRLKSQSSIIVGDFNTVADCGDCLAELERRGWQHARPSHGYSWRHAQSGKERQLDHLFCSAGISVPPTEYLWDFERLAPEAASRKVGLPDHAMLFADIELQSSRS